MNRKLLTASLVLTSSLMINAKNGITRSQGSQTQAALLADLSSFGYPATPKTPHQAPCPVVVSQAKILPSVEDFKASQRQKEEADKKARELAEFTNKWENLSENAQNTLKDAYLISFFFNKNESPAILELKAFELYRDGADGRTTIDGANLNTFLKEYQQNYNNYLPYIVEAFRIYLGEKPNFDILGKYKKQRSEFRNTLQEITENFPNWNLKDYALKKYPVLIPSAERKEHKKTLKRKISDASTNSQESQNGKSAAKKRKKSSH